MGNNGSELFFTFPRPGKLEWNQNQLLYDYEGSRRIVHMYGAITGPGVRQDDFCSTIVIDTLFAFDSLSHDPIILVIDSPGGTVWDGLLLCDAMSLIHSPVYVVARKVYSMGAVVLAAGEPGHRYVMPSSHLMLHLPQTELRGDSREIEISAKDFERTKEHLIDCLVQWGIKMDHDRILEEIDRPKWIWAQEAIDFGLADGFMPKGLLSHPRELPEDGA